MTRRIGFSLQVLILAQRQTALVAKQAACVDVLSGGRFRLGIGIGWNEAEFTALGENFHDRGRRSEEQVEVMKRLWAKEHVSFKGRWHDIPDVGINPLPAGGPEDWREEVRFWKDAGVTHITVNNARARGHHKRMEGRSLSDHIAGIERYREAVADTL